MNTCYHSLFKLLSYCWLYKNVGTETQRHNFHYNSNVWVLILVFNIREEYIINLTASGILLGGSGTTIRHTTKITSRSNRTQDTKLHKK
jgi:hypothetical protein